VALSPRRRAQYLRYAQYGALAAVAIALAVLADWPTIRQAFLNPEVLAALDVGALLNAFKNTLIYTGLGFAFAVALGLLLALMRLSSVAINRWLAAGYVEFFRGVPALLVFVALGFGVPLAFQTSMSIYTTVMLGLGLVGGAYLAETFRAGIQAVPRGQMEAARSLGMSSGRAMITVVIPQALRIVLPPLTNEFILLTKDSSLVYLLGFSTAQFEITKYGRAWMNDSGSMTPLLVAGLAYLAITLPLSQVVRRMETPTARAR
jgi:polar amino acid transport system permease protein